MNTIPPMSGTRIPGEFDRILNDPARLAGMAPPANAFPWRKLKDAGFVWDVWLGEAGGVFSK